MKRVWTYLYVALNALLIAAMLGVGIMTRLSFAHWGAESLQELRTEHKSATQEKVNPYPPEPEWSDEFNAYMSPHALSVSDISEQASDIFVGRFTGERSMGYGACASKVQVTRVYKGSAREASEVVVCEPFEVRTDASGVFETGASRIVGTVDQDSPYLHGMTPMYEGKTYLFFLEKRVVSPYRVAQPEFYNFLLSVYSRIPFEEEPRVVVREYSNDQPLSEISMIDLACVDEEARQTYLSTCAYLIGQYKE